MERAGKYSDDIEEDMDFLADQLDRMAAGEWVDDEGITEIDAFIKQKR
jgi:hypothetical protein